MRLGQTLDGDAHLPAAFSWEGSVALRAPSPSQEKASVTDYLLPSPKHFYTKTFQRRPPLRTPINRLREEGIAEQETDILLDSCR